MAAALLSLTDCCQPSCDICGEVTLYSVVSSLGSELVGWFKRKSIEEGRAIPTLPTNVHLEINGNEAGGDFFSGDFTWQNDLTAPDDGANILRPNDGLVGGWVRKT